ncbi:MAG: aminotransferase class I/II-fold pyridoxal phosphate-dependent enzyme [Acidimicrobiia bacterium]|nr:aminotransferase class I/II-fold pyridoxal phosphate-dependent enzyme [Acidimicrobiia bacterium]
MSHVGDAPAVLGGAPVRRGQYPAWPAWDRDDRDGLLAVLDSGEWWQGGGDVAAGFAAEFAAYHGAHHGLAMTNGTHTIEAALAACDVGDGDEVIVPGITFFASASAALAVNATPVLVDIDPETLCIDVAAAEAAVTARTRAVLAVHVAGAAADLDALTDLCDRRGLRLVEDCAHAHGTFWRGRGVGSWGDFGSFSMQQSKLMTAGEGGVLICNDERLRDRAWSYADCGRVAGEWFYHHPHYGSNLRMTEWQGAVLRAQLGRFPEQNRVRNENAVALGSALEEIPGLRPQRRDPRMDSQGSYCFVFHYDPEEFAGLPLRSFEAALAAEGIPVSVSYPSLSDLSIFRDGNFAPRMRANAPTIDYSSVHLPRAEHAAASTVWLEHRMLLGDREDVLDVARAASRIRHHAAAIASAG